MVFSDQTFLFFFLPLTLICAVAANRTRLFQPLLLLTSLNFFYWSSGIFVLLLLFSIGLNYLGGIAVERRRTKGTLALVVALNVLVLCYFKYTAFLLSGVGFLGSEAIKAFAEDIVLPIGISFFTFQGISYVVDVWRGEVKGERNLVLFAAYKAFFPQLIAGPIVRYKDVHEDFQNARMEADMFASGASRFMVGLCKKVLIADIVARVADAVFTLPGSEQTFASAWLGALAYTLQIYFDFSGYSDMALGLAMMFGIRFRENFNHPYAASTVTEFWRRWHISLSTWFRDYLYIPLGGNRKGSVRTYVNLMLVFATTGIWHGAGLTFLFWGIYHGLFLVLERLFLKDRVTRSQVLRMIYLLPVVMVGWALFRAPDLPAFGGLFLAMVSPLGDAAFTLPADVLVAISPLSVGILVLASALALLQGVLPPLGPLVANAANPLALYGRTTFVAVSAVICMVFVAPQFFSPFLYFRF